MPIWLLLGLGKLKSAFVALFGVVARDPWQSLCIALLLASAWLYHGKHKVEGQLHDCQTGRAADRKAYADAQSQALAKALAAKAAQEADYKQKAEGADDAKVQAVADARAAGEQYALTHRVRYQAAGSAPGGTAARPDNRNPGVPEGVPADTVVGISDADLQACSEVTAYAVEAHNWAVGLNATSPSH